MFLDYGKLRSSMKIRDVLEIGRRKAECEDSRPLCVGKHPARPSDAYKRAVLRTEESAKLRRRDPCPFRGSAMGSAGGRP